MLADECFRSRFYAGVSPLYGLFPRRSVATVLRLQSRRYPTPSPRPFRLLGCRQDGFPLEAKGYSRFKPVIGLNVPPDREKEVPCSPCLSQPAPSVDAVHLNLRCAEDAFHEASEAVDLGVELLCRPSPETFAPVASAGFTLLDVWAAAELVDETAVIISVVSPVRVEDAAEHLFSYACPNHLPHHSPEGWGVLGSAGGHLDGGDDHDVEDGGDVDGEVPPPSPPPAGDHRALIPVRLNAAAVGCHQAFLPVPPSSVDAGPHGLGEHVLKVLLGGVLHGSVEGCVVGDRLMPGQL